MNVAVVILNWNGKHLLEEYLPEVIKHSRQASIYVVDNASTDDSISYVSSKFPTVKLIKLDDNYGYAGGYNRAVKQINMPIQILMNNDIRPTKNWLQPIISSFEKNRNIAALQPKLLSDKNKQYFDYAGAGGGFIDHLGYPFCRGRLFNDIEKDEGQYDDEVEIFWASGACLAIRKEVFEIAGGFDELYFAHQEEIDLCWRINNLGYKIRVVPTSKVYHLGGGTLDEQHPKKTFYNFRNSLFNLLKNAPQEHFKQRILIRMLLDGLAFLQYMSLLKWHHAVMIFCAHIDFYKFYSSIIQKRKGYHNTTYFRAKSLVIQYFLLGRKAFSKIN